MKQSPEFTLTPGASISPASGTTLDFSEPQYYTVVSEDGQWKKRYEVSYVITGIGTQYSFEKVRHEGKAGYDVFYETDDNGNTIMDWASGNPGFTEFSCFQGICYSTENIECPHKQVSGSNRHT